MAYEYQYLEVEEVRQRVLQELRQAESNHIAARVNAEVNREKAKILRASAQKAGGKVDMAVVRKAATLEIQVRQLEIDAEAYEEGILSLQKVFSDVIGVSVEAAKPAEV